MPPNTDGGKLKKSNSVKLLFGCHKNQNSPDPQPSIYHPHNLSLTSRKTHRVGNFEKKVSFDIKLRTKAINVYA